jgi:glycosyltransferase involved in cell wall biosynthesis
VLKDKYNALLCPYNDPKAWANALQKLLENPILRHSLGQQALDDFIKHYTWQSRAEYILRGLEIDSNNMFNKLQVIS